MSENEVYDEFFLGMFQGFYEEDSLFKSEPLMKLLDKEFGSEEVYPQNEKNSKRALNIGISNVNNATYVSFNDNFKSKDLMHTLKASVSYPGIFPPVEAWNSTWFSGSTVMNIDVAAPIIRCKNLGFAEEDIVIDAILDSDFELGVVDASNYNVF